MGCGFNRSIQQIVDIVLAGNGVEGEQRTRFRTQPDWDSMPLRAPPWDTPAWTVPGSVLSSDTSVSMSIQRAPMRIALRSLTANPRRHSRLGPSSRPASDRCWREPGWLLLLRTAAGPIGLRRVLAPAPTSRPGRIRRNRLREKYPICRRAPPTLSPAKRKSVPDAPHLPRADWPPSQFKTQEFPCRSHPAPLWLPSP
jgi:hypothetical protein